MLSDALSYMNTTFTLFFTIECVLKLTTFGRVKFLRRGCPPCPQCENLIKFNELLVTLILSVDDFDRLLIICNPFFRSKFKSSLMKIVISGPAVHRGIVGIFPHLILADTLTLFQSD